MTKTNPNITYDYRTITSNGFSEHIFKAGDLTADHIEEYLNKNHIKFRILSDETSPCHSGYFTENVYKEKICRWTSHVGLSLSLYEFISSTSFLLAHTRLSKHNTEKIKKVYLKCTLDFYCDEYPYADDYKKLAEAIIKSYKNYGIYIDTVKDFKKLISRDAGAEFIKIKFLEEEQAAEFVMQYGSKLQK